MTETITNIINHPTKRLKLIQAGRERLKRYSWENAVKETEKVYLKASEGL